MISLLIVGPVRLITHRESLFPIPASPDGAAPTSRGHADPTDRIAKRFCQRLALVVEVSLLGEVIEIEGIGIGLVQEQPATAARCPAALLETKIPISLRVAHCATNHKMKCGSWRHMEDSRLATICCVELIVIETHEAVPMKE
jgi:hypothetical protein